MTIRSLPSLEDSPASTSSVSSSSPGTISFRKRQRSTSVDSVAEEVSLKRGSPRFQIDSLSINDTPPMDEDAEMDLYLKEQGHDESPSATEKLTRIAELKHTPMAHNQTWYLVDRAWCRRWRAALGEVDPKANAEPLSESELGPPSTSALLDQYGNLKPGLVEEVDVEFFPEEAWSLLVSWYGSPPTPLPRRTIARGINRNNISLELHPPTIRVFRMIKDSEHATVTSSEDTSPPASVTLSTHTTVKDLCRAAVSAVHTGTASNLPQHRVWRLTDSSPPPAREFPVSKLISADLLDATASAGSKTLEEAAIEHGDSFVVEFQDVTTRKWLTESEDDAAPPGALFKSNDGFFDRMSGASTSLVPFSDSASGSKPNGVVKAEIDKKLTVVVKERERWTEPGTLGLGNMGNTCFMNSALQCLAHQKELSDYFITGVYTSELNPDNPLGMGGAIAEGFGALLCRMWAGSKLAQMFGAEEKLKAESGGFSGTKSKVTKFFGKNTFGGYGGFGGGDGFKPSATSYTPRAFKSQISRFAPQFSGYQQHDSQELVAFLLDGLHEDLNRVLKKPYVEKPDWFGARPPVRRPFRERRTAEIDGEEEDKEEYKLAKEEYEEKEREAYKQEHGWDKELEEDKEMLRFARESWEGYKRRNDSVVVDLFQGQYRSTLVCPECEKVSITFDPFMYLTLPLPIQKKWHGVVYYVPWNLSKPHIKVPVEIGRDASFKDLRALLGRWMSVPPENLLTLECFNHRFYKNLDDTILCGEMGDNDTIVCFELPCNSQQSRTWKRSDHPDDPWVLPMLLSDAPTTSFGTGANAFGPKTYGGGSYRTDSAFGYPTIAVVTTEQAKSVEGIYEAAVERLARWTRQQRDLWTWELPDGFTVPVPGLDDNVETIRLYPMEEDGVETITEIGEDGAVVNVTQPIRQQPTPPTPAEEGDIVDEKSMVLDIGEDALPSALKSAAPVRLGPKKDLFNLRLSTGHKDYGVSSYGITSVSWEARILDAKKGAEAKGEEVGALLREGDALYCEFDENLKAFYFGEDRSFPKFEHALWDNWEEFLHPEYEESLKAASSKSSRGISLSDCLDEFTKEEQLGADDLWYCPQCKKHQQATKKFDLWSTPDVLVVHLKRFSNSRMLRDKIDAFVDFPVLGLNLNERVDERRIISRLKERGVDVESTELLGRGSDGNEQMGGETEPLLYDLFGVDEHIGGLGGGHYRAYAQNHMNNKWYHFDDSFVSESTAEKSVNQNAYLLFYRRRTSAPLGGPSHHLVEQALRNPPKREPTTSASSSASSNEMENNDELDMPELENPSTIQLPTPPNEPDGLPLYDNSPSSSTGNGSMMNNWHEPHGRSLHVEPPHFEISMGTHLLADPVRLFDDDVSYDSVSRYSFPEPSSSPADYSSPASSVGAEPDYDADPGDDLDGEGDAEDQGPWSRARSRGRDSSAGGEPESGVREISPSCSSSAFSASHVSSGIASPHHSEDSNPFTDERVEMKDVD